MADDGTDWAEDELTERPYGAKPYGAKPYGAKPYGAKPYGAKPYGAKPYGAKPYGAKPYGAKAYDESGNSGALDRDAWGEDVCDLVLSRSALVRLGATVVSSDEDVWIPKATPIVAFRGPGVPPEADPGAADPVSLSPREWRLEAWVSVPNQSFRSLAANPELSYALKADLAEGLARQADRAFLDGPDPPGHVAAHAGEVAAGADLLQTVRSLVTAVRERDEQPAFRRPGWILQPATLGALTSVTTSNGLVPGGDQARTLDALRLLTLDGVDGGTLLGFPFATSTRDPAASDAPRVFFAADWEQAYVGVGGTPVVVDLPADPQVRDGVVVRASMTLDFALRRADGFAWAAVQ